MQASEILRGAAEKIAGGWCQGEYEKDGKVCSLGAIFDVAYNNASEFDGMPLGRNEKGMTTEVWTAITALSEVMCSQYDEAAVKKSVGMWFVLEAGRAAGLVATVNDSYAKDVSEIVACMEKAAVNLEADHGTR